MEASPSIDHRYATFENVSTKDIHAGKAREVLLSEHCNTNYVAKSRYWVHKPFSAILRSIRHKTVAFGVETLLSHKYPYLFGDCPTPATVSMPTA
jgi:hypothetical protein